MKKIVPIILISFLAIQSLHAQGDSTKYERRPFQFTFLFPPLSTNGAKNAQIVNDVSLNLFLGVSGGVEVFEAATFINIDQYYMHGAQLAGFGNTVGGSVSGAQVAGFFNVAGTEVKGAQVAGFVNVAGDSLDGFQVFGQLIYVVAVHGAVVPESDVFEYDRKRSGQPSESFFKKLQQTSSRAAQERNLADQDVHPRLGTKIRA